MSLVLISWFKKRALYKALFVLLLQMKFPVRSRVLLASVYLIIISALFCLPGSALPKADWLSKIYFDKWVHIGFFFVLIIIWLWALQLFKKAIVFLLIAAAIYGLTVEIVQHL